MKGADRRTISTREERIASNRLALIWRDVLAARGKPRAVNGAMPMRAVLIANMADALGTVEEIDMEDGR